MKWLLAILIACAVVMIFVGAISALASFVDNNPLAGSITLFVVIIGMIARMIRSAL
jgi:nicotinamide riboside transporter PnuC